MFSTKVATSARKGTQLLPDQPRRVSAQRFPPDAFPRGAFPRGAFLESIIAFLLPYFTIAPIDTNDARAEVIETLASYGARTRPEMLQAAQIIALGMSTLDALAESQTGDLSPSMRLRCRARADASNRSMLQTEKALSQRLTREPAAPEERPQPIDDRPNASAERAGPEGATNRAPACPACVDSLTVRHPTNTHGGTSPASIVSRMGSPEPTGTAIRLQRFSGPAQYGSSP
jgi:hypothetical protein